MKSESFCFIFQSRAIYKDFCEIKYNSVLIGNFVIYLKTIILRDIEKPGV